MYKKAGYFGIDKTASNLKISRKKAKELLDRESTHQRTTYKKHSQKKFSKIMASPKNPRPDQFQGDLLDVAQLKHKNGGYRFLCVYVDVFSRKAWVFPIKKKTTSELMRVNKPFLTEHRPLNITWDHEAAIRSREIDKLLKKLDIRRWHPDKDQPDDKKLATAIVERFNRTLRTWITRHTVDNKTKKYVDALPAWVDTYNNTQHRGINQRTPQSVWDSNTFVHKDRPRDVLPIGTKVRVKLSRTLFQKKTQPAWSDKVYIVKKHSGQKYLVGTGTENSRLRRLGGVDLKVVPQDFEVSKDKPVKSRTFFAKDIQKPFSFRRSTRLKKKPDRYA